MRFVQRKCECVTFLDQKDLAVDVSQWTKYSGGGGGEGDSHT